MFTIILLSSSIIINIFLFISSIQFTNDIEKRDEEIVILTDTISKNTLKIKQLEKELKKKEKKNAKSKND